MQQPAQVLFTYKSPLVGFGVLIGRYGVRMALRCSPWVAKLVAKQMNGRNLTVTRISWAGCVSRYTS